MATAREKMPVSEGRAYCYECMRVARMCLCSSLQPPCTTRTELHVLQHRREAQHAFGTVRLLRKGLPEMKVHRLPSDIGQEFPRPSGFPRGSGAGFLYPGPQAIPLEGLSREEQPEKLVVIDGTWSQAHRMVRDHAWLRELPQYSLEPTEPSRYRIRKEPSAECLSTLESAVMALRLLEPDNRGLDRLLHAFELMNERQLEAMARNSGAQKRQKRPRLGGSRAVPEPLWRDPKSIVVVYGECAQPFLHRDKKMRELAQWCAIRLSEPTGQFHRIISTEVDLPSGQFLRDLGWREEVVEGAVPLTQVLDEWGQFVADSDCLVAWNKSTLRLARHHGFLGAKGRPRSGVVLKEAYGNIRDGAFGTLEDVLRHEEIVTDEPCSLRFAGRAGVRMRNAWLAAQYLCRWGQSHNEGGAAWLALRERAQEASGKNEPESQATGVA